MFFKPLQDQLLDQQITTHLDWFGPYWCQFQSLNNSTSLWLITKSVKWRLLIPFKTNSAKYQPIQTDLGALTAISAFQSLNKTASPIDISIIISKIMCVLFYIKRYTLYSIYTYTLQQWEFSPSKWHLISCTVSGISSGSLNVKWLTLYLCCLLTEMAEILFSATFFQDVLTFKISALHHFYFQSYNTFSWWISNFSEIELFPWLSLYSSESTSDGELKFCMCKLSWKTVAGKKISHLCS